MAVAVDASATAPTIVGTATTSASLTTLTVGSSATALLAVVNSNNNLSGLTLTWDNGGTNQAMTFVGSVNITSGWIWIFGLLNPTPGAKTLRASWTGSLTCILDALSFTGTATDTIANAFQNFNSAKPAASTSHTITLTGASGNISFCTSANNTNTYTSPYLNTTGSTNLYHDATHVAGTAAYAPSASSVVWTDHTSSSLADVLAGVDVAVPAAPTSNSATGSGTLALSCTGTALQSDNAQATASFLPLSSVASISDWAYGAATFLPLTVVGQARQYDRGSSTATFFQLSATAQIGQSNAASCVATVAPITGNGTVSLWCYGRATLSYASSGTAGQQALASGIQTAFAISAVGHAASGTNATGQATLPLLTGASGQLGQNDQASATDTISALSAVGTAQQFNSAVASGTIDALSSAVSLGQSNHAQAAGTIEALTSSATISDWSYGKASLLTLSAVGAAGQVGQNPATGVATIQFGMVGSCVLSISAFLRTPIGPQTPWHFAPNANWPSNFDPNLQ